MSKKTKAKKRRAATRVERLFPQESDEQKAKSDYRLDLLRKRQRRRLTAQKAERRATEAKKAKVDRSPLYVLAEKAATKSEIKALLEVEANKWLEGESSASREALIIHLNGWLDQFEFAAFSRKKTVERVAARAMRRRGFYRMPGIPGL